MDYGGVGIAFKLGGTIKYSTELYAYVTSFGLGMNEDFWNKLPADLKKLVTDSVTGKEAEVGQAWDSLDVPGKKAVVDGGGEPIKLPAAEMDKVRRIGAEVSEAKVKEYEAKGMPARALYNEMRALSEKHAKTSKNFWN
jgi:TRAP-type C4-dicarboxylate transport system substrate-binding protein